MTGIVHICPGSLVQTNEGERCIVRQLASPTTALVRNLFTAEDQIKEISSLKSLYAATKRGKRDLETIDDAAFESAYEKYRAINALLESPNRSVADVEVVAQAISVNRSTIYRWITEFQKGELVTNLLRKRRADAGTTKLDARAEKLMGQVIADFWLTAQRRSMRNAYRELVRLSRHEDIVPPAYNTFRARLAALDQASAATKREGPKAAQRFRVTQGTVPHADYPYAVLQIDHTFLDVMLVDEEHRIAIGRPWITLAIDVFSRMVAGYYVSLDPPGTLGTGICIANAILPKDGFLSRLGLKYSYPCMGKPRVIHVDNAKEFRGNTLSKACMERGINLIFRKVKTPNYGGHIERYLGTLAQEIHALPGATFASHAQREVYDSDKESAMTLSDLEKWLGNLIVGAYHHREHTSLKMPPVHRYAQGLLGSDTMIGSGQISLVTDEEVLRIDFLPMVERTIQHYGVSVDGIQYYADVLRRWAGAADPAQKKLKRKFLFRRDPRDISYLLFYDPDAEQYFRIPYRDTNHPPISLWELRATVRHLESQGKKNVDEVQIFRAYDEMRRIEEESKTLTRKTRLAQERRRRHEAARKENATKVEQEPPSFLEQEPVPSDIAPFDEIEQY
jgi:putative transposase